ncbi:hypothetical protein BD289DRAFT_430491 [Coniella lustricola]|uniref:Uncharacterized protein n=1 Tax=Coniella lustricola TaxID=2025994 RepID=A0A2T3ABQ1_9PEZI|nr:hypothetical protein BD289DRAFT_430491 [Coniella lustricola]
MSQTVTSPAFPASQVDLSDSDRQILRLRPRHMCLAGQERLPDDYSERPAGPFLNQPGFGGILRCIRERQVKSLTSPLPPRSSRYSCRGLYQILTAGEHDAYDWHREDSILSGSMKPAWRRSGDTIRASRRGKQNGLEALQPWLKLMGPEQLCQAGLSLPGRPSFEPLEGLGSGCDRSVDSFETTALAPASTSSPTLAATSTRCFFSFKARSP